MDSFEIITIIIGVSLFSYIYISSFIIIIQERQHKKVKRYEGRVVKRNINKDNNFQIQIETVDNYKNLLFLTNNKLSVLEILILPLKEPYHPFSYLTEKLYKDMVEGSYVVVEGISIRKGIIRVTELLDKR